MNLTDKFSETYCSRLLSLVLVCLILLVAGCQQETPEVTEEEAAPAESVAEEPAETIPEITGAVETFVNAEEKPAILVTGATGKQGGALAAELQARGFYVRGFTRDASQPKALTLAESGIEMVEGDFTRPDTLLAAMQDMYGLFLVTPNIPEQVSYAENAIEAAKSAGIRHIVYSGNLSGHPDYVRPDTYKARIERMVKESGIDYTILRPVTFMENYAGLKDEIARHGIRDPRRPDTLQQFISVKDIGFIAAGDEMTGEELAALFSRVMGIPVEYHQVAWEEWSETRPPHLIELYRWTEEGAVRVDIEALRQDYPDLRTFEQYLRETGWENWTG